VSHAAPAHHFKDRTGLLTAIAAEGHDLLARALREAADLREAGVRYVRFAREHPAHFQVMFAPYLLRTDDAGLVAARTLSDAALREAVAGVPTRDRGVETRLAGIAAWSLAHGFATLLLAHNLDDALGAGDPEEMFRELAATLFRPGAPGDAGGVGPAPHPSPRAAALPTRTAPSSGTPPSTTAVPGRSAACRRSSRSWAAAPAPAAPSP
jgi:AcrR family transcriptional regulator